jgi:hypothetical protein
MDVKMIGIGFVLSILLTSTLYYGWLRNTTYNRSTILFILLITIILSFMLGFMFTSIKSNEIKLDTPNSLGYPQRYQAPQAPQPFQYQNRPQVNVQRPPQVVPYNQPAQIPQAAPQLGQQGQQGLYNPPSVPTNRFFRRT